MKLFKKISLSISLFIIFSIVAFLAIYAIWRKDMGGQSENILCYTQRSESVDIKIRDFIISDRETEFVIFEVEEVLTILHENTALDGQLEMENICLKPEKSVWSLYLQYSYEGIQVPFIILEISKDNRETAEIYASQISIGPLELPQFLSKTLLVNINKGISDALILVNENRFLGRQLKNVELLEQTVVLKGTL